MNEEIGATPECDDVCVAAAAAREALDALAHATSIVEDSREIYDILHDLSAAATSLSKSLTALSGEEDGPTRSTPRLNGSDRDGRAAGFRVSTALRRAGDFFATAGGASGAARDVVDQLTYVQDYGLTVRRLHPVDRGSGQ